MSTEWYPIKFTPIYGEFSWGGTLLQQYYQRDVPVLTTPIGESYEIIDDDSRQSIVENGPHRGKGLRELITSDAAGLVGDRFSAVAPFPLLVKYIDTAKRLPLQVHPDAALCHHISDARPNTKIWYVINSWEQARIMAGIKRQFTQQIFRSRVRTPDVEKMVQSFPSEPGDAYFMAPGRIHALDAGNLVLSIEQSGGTTYELTNWQFDNTSEVTADTEIESGLSCVQFQDRTLARIRGESTHVQRNRKIQLVRNCPAFSIDELRLVNDYHDRTDGSSFHILTTINGSVLVTSNNYSVELEYGRSCLIPAAVGAYTVVPQTDSLNMLKVARRTN